ncbi:GDSL-type esterase/lipase family protein [Corynebacterium sp. HS2168-gen11]|uniref:GDSL-type esterase/lipase family protein n=1 Tax=Corynebacterium sp. HS2168-gen11 TaxID=2974027 RepID=UPI00216ABDED|nr:GDSL-type esterase/lipase family protein [Corynebacterium sp. HS2168-gen11]MCS4535286.1 GDSL-type esterase/lipase family protein [Corynebacterium sp. HS2168-gen11]
MRHSITRLLAAVTTALLGCTLWAAPAQATGRQIVLFGDSLMANPYFGWADYIQGPGKVSPNAPGQGRCPRSESRIATSLARITGDQVEDFACTGAVAYAPIERNKRLSNQINTAIDQRHLHAGTNIVLIQIGFNDTWKAPGFFNVQTEGFVREMQTQVARIRQAAPNARIAFLSYPSLIGPSGQSCPIHVRGLPPIVIHSRLIRSAFDSVSHWQRQSATATGTEWIDIATDSVGHDMCAPTEQRWVAGIIDNASDPYNITTHLTHRGNDEIAAIIARKI